MKITDYSREQIQQFIKDGICPVQALRDYDILKAITSGEKIVNVAIDNNLCRDQVRRIRDKYMPKA